jgi:hypothetical protein
MAWDMDRLPRGLRKVGDDSPSLGNLIRAVGEVNDPCGVDSIAKTSEVPLPIEP